MASLLLAQRSDRRPVSVDTGATIIRAANLTRLDKHPAEDRSKPYFLYVATGATYAAHHIADKFPQKLRELKLLFDREAKKNSIYPLGNLSDKN